MVFALSLANSVFAKTNNCIQIEKTNETFCVGNTVYWGPWNYLPDGSLDIRVLYPYLNGSFKNGKIIAFNLPRLTALISTSQGSIEKDIRDLYLNKNIIGKAAFKIGDVVSFGSLTQGYSQGVVLATKKVKKYGNAYLVKENGSNIIHWLSENGIAFIKKAWNSRWLSEK